jgi:hypothetical protein
MMYSASFTIHDVKFTPYLRDIFGAPHEVEDVDYVEVTTNPINQDNDNISHSISPDGVLSADTACRLLPPVRGTEQD